MEIKDHDKTLQIHFQICVNKRRVVLMYSSADLHNHMRVLYIFYITQFILIQ